MFLGPQLYLPWGFMGWCVGVIVVLMIISMIVWKCMDHYPEDEEAWDDNDNNFVLKGDDE